MDLRETLGRSDTKLLPGSFVTTDDQSFQGRVFYVENQIRHWVVDAAYFKAYGFEWPTDLLRVPVQEIRSLKIGGQLPWPWTEEDLRDPPKKDWTSLRELAACSLHGRGVEFGAGTAPFCVPPRCDVEFADFFTKAQLLERSYKSQLDANPDFVDLTYITTIEEMIGVPNESLDFVVACHVIEHTRNPIKAIVRSFEALKPGGKLVLIVPDQRLTFDKNRKLTTLDHLIEDFNHPDPERDEEHYYDFCENVMGIQKTDLPAFVKSAVEKDLDLHFHVWTHDTFASMLSSVRLNIVPWSKIWTHPPGTGDIANEFYAVLTK